MEPEVSCDWLLSSEAVATLTLHGGTVHYRQWQPAVGFEGRLQIVFGHFLKFIGWSECKSSLHRHYSSRVISLEGA